MTLTQLSYLYQIHRLGSFRRAAKELHVSQPAVTEAIHALEAEFNLPLILRKGNQTLLTEAGERMLQTAEVFKREEASLRQDLEGLARKAPVRLRLSVCLYTPLPLAKLEAFRSVHPDFSVALEQSSALHVLQALEEESCDLGILYTQMLSGKTPGLPCGAQEFGVFCPPGHPFLSYEAVPQELILAALGDSAEGQKDPEAKEDPDSRTSSSSHSLSLASRTLSGVFHPSLDPMLEALQARLNRRVAVLPLAFKDERGGLIPRPIDPPFLLPQSLAWNTKHFLSREAADLRDALLKESEEA